jgi:hypothetical protein
MKKLAFLVAFLLACLVGSRVDATLYDYYADKGLKLPAVSERIPLAEQCGISNYIGTASQNIALEACLKGNLGGTSPVAGSTYTLAGSGVSASASSITLTSLTIPQTGYELQDSDFGDTFYVTLEPGSTKRQEIVSCTTVTQNAGDTATLSGCSRGLLPFGAYTASTTYAFAHSGGTSVIFSDAPQLFNLYAAKSSAETISGAWVYSGLQTFYTFPIVSSTGFRTLPVNDGDVATKYYADLMTGSGFTSANISTGYHLKLVTSTPVAQVGVDTSTLFSDQPRTSTVVNLDCDNALTCITTSTFTAGFRPTKATFMGSVYVHGEFQQGWYGSSNLVQGTWLSSYPAGYEKRFNYYVSSTAAAGASVSFTNFATGMWLKGVVNASPSNYVTMKINTTSATGISYVTEFYLPTTTASNISVDGILIFE